MSVMEVLVDSIIVSVVDVRVKCDWVCRFCCMGIIGFY